MAKTDRFKIAYIGGGSRFVVTLLHGLAGRAEEIKKRGRPIELALCDPDVNRAGEMARYAEIVARKTGVAIAPGVTGKLADAVDAADWVIFSAGLGEREQAAMARFGGELPADANIEAGPRTAISAAAVWPVVREVASCVRQSAPAALLTTLVNPTDVTAAAAHRAFGIASIGMCVEVGGLVGFLSYYLRIPAGTIGLDHIGVNHVGWVGRWTVRRQEGDDLFRRGMPERLWQDDWYGGSQLVVDLHEATGCLRSSAYHPWPYRAPWGPKYDEQAKRWLATCLPGWPSKWAYRKAAIEEALAAGRMIAEPDGTAVHPEATPYLYPDTRHVFGAVLAGRLGAQPRAVALQVPNESSNPSMPIRAWIEVPTCVQADGISPETATPPPEALMVHLRAVAEQRSCLADWLVTGERKYLTRALLALPDGMPTDTLVRLARELPAALEA